EIAERGDEDKAALRKRLLAASNTKLLRLHDVSRQIQELGGRDKLVDAILEHEKRGKDKDYRARVATYTSARLLDVYRAGRRRAPRGKSANKKKGKAA